MSTYLQGVSGRQETPDPTPVGSTAQQQLRYLVSGVDSDAVAAAIDEAGYDAVTA